MSSPCSAARARLPWTRWRSAGRPRAAAKLVALAHASYVAGVSDIILTQNAAKPVAWIRARLPRLLEWLEREQPEVVALQELKCADESLPIADIEAAGYGAVWHGQKGFNGVAVLAKGDTPELRRIGLPGDPDDSHSRYIEAEVDGLVVGSIYLPHGNPVGTEKFDYKLRWMERLCAHAAELLVDERPAVLCGDWNVVPEDRDVFSVRAT